jgi:hypothetical protein
VAAWTFPLSFDATRFSNANRQMLARYHPWLLGYLIASMLASIFWLQHWSFGCSAARLDTFAGCAAASSILRRLWTIALCIWILLPHPLFLLQPPQLSPQLSEFPFATCKVLLIYCFHPIPVVIPVVRVSLRLTCKVLISPPRFRL